MKSISANSSYSGSALPEFHLLPDESRPVDHRIGIRPPGYWPIIFSMLLPAISAKVSLNPVVPFAISS